MRKSVICTHLKKWSDERFVSSFCGRLYYHGDGMFSSSFDGVENMAQCQRCKKAFTAYEANMYQRKTIKKNEESYT